jgi:hypothetical protein
MHVFLTMHRNAGNLFTSLFSGLFGQQDVRILILGLDGAGKTTVCCRDGKQWSRLNRAEQRRGCGVTAIAYIAKCDSAVDSTLFMYALCLLEHLIDPLSIAMWRSCIYNPKYEW